MLPVLNIVDQILSTCGSGSILDVGCTDALLVQSLLAQGIDAHGMVTVLSLEQKLNNLLTGRFSHGVMTAFPYADNAFDTLCSSSVIDQLDDADVETALAEYVRVTRRYAFFRVDVSRGRDRIWWETRGFEAGFRKHPLFFDIVSYESLEHEPGTILLLFERIPESAGQRFPLAQLCEERDQYKDMLREAGRRSDAHCVRYAFARQYVRPRDTVVDAACGLGYGSAILWDGTQAARVIGIDSSSSAISYARDCYAPLRERVDFVEADAVNLSFIGTESVGTVVSFETVEHVIDSDAFLAEVQRILIPGGRFICSVPNLWVDESGKDVGEFHLHSFDYLKIKQLCERYFLVEQVFAQNAGGGYKYSDQGRSFREVDPECDNAGVEAEWWIVVGMKNPLSANPSHYMESIYPCRPGHECKAVTLADYENPWIYHSLFNITFRVKAFNLLQRLCLEVYETSHPLSPDAGGALCVLAYRVLEAEKRDVEKEELIIQKLKKYTAGIIELMRNIDCPPHVVRWMISNQFVLARLLLLRGELEKAREAFWQCACLPFEQYSPLIATKTIEAAFQAGWLAMNSGDEGGARMAWRHGVEMGQRAVSGKWNEMLGSNDGPYDFGMHEATQILDVARKCCNGLRCLPMLRAKPGFLTAYVTDSYGTSLARMLHDKQCYLKREAFQSTREAFQITREALVREELRSVLGTWSWRLTAPLRVVGSTLSRFVKFCRKGERCE